MPPEDAAARGAAAAGDRGDGSDRLSGLRDELLLRVLSHLKAWEAVRSCLLSQRWRDLWTYTGHLDIRQPCLCRRGAAGGLASAYRRRAREEAFNTFVRKLLLLRRPLVPLLSFRLCWTHQTGDGDTNTWISHAVRHKAEEIQLSAKHHRGYPTPEYMSFIAGDVKTGLKILKFVHLCLDDTTLTHTLDDTTLTRLSSRCTSLQEIELKDCIIPKATAIKSEMLKRLTMIKCRILKSLLSVDAPNLVSMQFSRNFGYVPWIENLGLLAASNVNQRVTREYADCSGLSSCSLEILKLSRVKLDDTTLAQLCSRCTSLEKLELKECSVVGKEIRSPSLRFLSMVSCEFTTESVVHAPNLVSLCCTRPFRHVPQFQNMEYLVTASITIDDYCMTSDSQWTLEDDDKDKFDDDGDFFAHFTVKYSDDNSGIELDQDEEDESDHDGAHSGAEGSESTEDEEDESDHDGAHYGAEGSESTEDEEDESDNDGAHSGAEGSDDNGEYESTTDKEDESDHDGTHVGAEDSDGNHGCSGPGVDDDSHTVGMEEIPEVYNNDCGRMFGGHGILCSLSKVRTMDLFAHSGEVLLMRESESCTDFENLKTLSLGEWCITPDFGVLAAILRRSPNLENLSVHLDMANKARVGFKLRANLFACTNLKKVEITCCTHDIVCKLIDFFDMNSIPREKISFHWTACNCVVKRGTGSQAKRKAQTEAEKIPAKQNKAGN